METRITATELAKSLSDILNRVRYRSETFVIVRSGEEIAILAPKGPIAAATLQHLAAALRDRVSPGEGFADDLEAIQASQPRLGDPNWPN